MAQLARPQTGMSSLGSPIPALTPHAVSVSLPKWADNVDYEEGRPRVTQAMQTGYPRFFIHRDIQKLAEICVTRFGLPSEACMLFPSSRTAESCKTYLADPLRGDGAVASRVVRFCVRPSLDLVPCPPPAAASEASEPSTSTSKTSEDVALHVVYFPAASFPLAKSYWQHTGHGISSRLAERCLRILGSCPVREEVNGTSSAAGGSSAVAEGSGNASPTDEKAAYGASGIRGRYGRNRRFMPHRQTSALSPSGALPTPPLTPPVPRNADVDSPVEPETATYLEERYGRNLSARHAQLAKTALKRRIAGVLRTNTAVSTDRRRSSVAVLDTEASHSPSIPTTTDSDEAALATSSFLEPSERAGGQLTENDVFLYPGGMTAIFHAHQLVLSTRAQDPRRPGKSVCFGFPYTDTLKILQKWGPGCHFFGHGTASDLDKLEALLRSSRASADGEPPVQALFCEFPSNPLLRSPDLTRIRQLADEYDFIVVVDETIGTFVNVEVLPFADVVVSSLTKVFSGDSNVMGGSLVLSPTSRHYPTLKAHLEAQYEDIYFGEDAVYMERNSRDFRPRIKTINRNALLICDYLHSLVSDPASSIKAVYYPKYSDTRANYDARLRPSADHSCPGYGGLFSVTFGSLKASEAFFDALGCQKGPSLGTNFTLACPYTVLAHYLELDWAAEWGVEVGLVRVSVGLESEDRLMEWFTSAVRAADQAFGRHGQSQ